MTNTLSIIILCLLLGLCISGCKSMTPEQEKLVKELKAEISDANMALAKALQIPSDLLIKLNNGDITSKQFNELMAVGKETIANAQKKVGEAKLKYDEAKASGISMGQMAWSFAGGTFGRSLLHIVAGLFTSGSGGWVATILTGLLGGSRSGKTAKG